MLLGLGGRAVAVTLGKRGVLLRADGRSELIEPHAVAAVDTTAAGDAFAGAMAVRWAASGDLGEAVRFANAARRVAGGGPSGDGEPRGNFITARSHAMRRSQVCVAVLATFVLAGCSGGADRGTTDGDPDRPRVALVMKSLANEFFSTMADGARAHRAEHAGDYELVINGIKDERDVTRQAALVEEMVAGGADAIVIAPADSRALVPSLRRAIEAGVVVVNIDNRLDPDLLAEEGLTIPFVGPDNRAGAKAVGDYLATRLTAGDEVVVVEGIRTSANARARKEGFEAAMAEADVTIVDSQSADWEMAAANTVVASMLREQPGVDAVLAANDNMALGAVAAVKSLGKTGEVLIVGFDNIEAVRRAIGDGVVLATADQYGDRLAVFGIETALELLADPEASPEDIDTPVDLITRETLEAAAMTLDGEPYAPRRKPDAERAGVHIVQQELNVIPTLTVAENMFLTRLPRAAGVIRRGELVRRAGEVLDRVGLDGIDPSAIAGTLGVGARQMVEIAAALDRDCRVLILDEPTASLSGGESRKLFAWLRLLRDEGVGIVYISHRLKEVADLSDRVTVLRDGRTVATRDAAGLTPDEMVALMSGYTAAAVVPFASRTADGVGLRIDGLTGRTGL